jgi:hypothetical protein
VAVGLGILGRNALQHCTSQGLVFRKGTHTVYSSSFDRTVKIWDLDQMCYMETLYVVLARHRGTLTLLGGGYCPMTA